MRKLSTIGAALLPLSLPAVVAAQDETADSTEGRVAVDGEAPPLATLEPQADGQMPLPSFEMYGLRTDQVYDGRISFADNRCNISVRGEDFCRDLNGTTLGSAEINWIAAQFMDGRLQLIMGETTTANFRDLAHAFTTKYGEANQIEETEVQNRMGATFDNVTMRWRFSDGFLELIARQGQIDTSVFRFVPASSLKEPTPPPVNF